MAEIVVGIRWLFSTVHHLLILDGMLPLSHEALAYHTALGSIIILSFNGSHWFFAIYKHAFINRTRENFSTIHFPFIG